MRNPKTVSVAAAAALRAVLAPKREQTQKTLADELHVSPQSVSNWCLGRSRPEPKHWPRIEELLHIPRTLWMTDDERAAAGLDSTEAA